MHVKIRIRSAMATAAAVVLAAGILVGGGSAAYAAGAPPWEPDPGNEHGTVSFFDANGSPVTQGSIDSHPFVGFAVASGPGRSTDDRALLRFATPQPAVNPGLWNAEGVTPSTIYPNPAAPPNIRNSPNAVVTGNAATDLSLADYIADIPNTSTDPNFANIYQVRLLTSGPGAGVDNIYFAADVLVNPTARTWQLVFPVINPTTTALTA